ncbi:hypothetical protein NTJ56_19505 [Burkholderia contaminans]|uniref:hypothetical protein n=1 Tax=Burkholderia contaminans TaxID=488447 RepID=UPI001CF3262E|nr:hypothetical protein [Burkholderia contaminans]MCA7915975.1 hypothetical protein [Burkholderia contaminans]UUX40628.1 hypothetical protein NTJ56_19505 [Burkholderia contaminans]
MTQHQRKSLILMGLWSVFQTEFNFSANSVGKGHLFCHSPAKKFAEKMLKSLIYMDRRDHLFREPTGGGTGGSRRRLPPMSFIQLEGASITTIGRLARCRFCRRCRQLIVTQLRAGTYPRADGPARHWP